MIRVTLGLFFCWVLLLPAQSTDQTSTPTAAAQLAARISSLLPRRATVSLEFQNLTGLTAAEWSSFPSQLREELRKAGVETAATPPESRVHVTLSEGSRGLLLVAEISTGDNRQVAMLPWTLSRPAQSQPRIALTAKPLLAQTEPILDIRISDSGSQMLVLSPQQVARYRLIDGKWIPTDAASLALARPMPRDPRGRLEATAEGFQAFLPVATCTGAWNSELKLTCTTGTANWPGTAGTHWVADRNVLESDAPAPSFEGWGSDWASIADPCGAGTIEIASSADNEHDSVRAYLIEDRRADPVSNPLPLPGPVTALWPSESGPAGSSKEATLVVHNLQTGEYEASRLGVACTH